MSEKIVRHQDLEVCKKAFAGFFYVSALDLL